MSGFVYANAHRGKVRKANHVPVVLRTIAEEPRPVPCKGWAEMIRKVYEVDPLRCPRCGGRMKVIAFLTEYAVVDRIREHLKLSEEYIDFLDINLIGATISYRF